MAFRATEEQYLKVQAIADGEGVSISEVLRHLIDIVRVEPADPVTRPRLKLSKEGDGGDICIPYTKGDIKNE